MRKFLLVVFVGMALAINVYGLVNDIMEHYEVKDVEIDRGYTTVYVE